MGAITSMWCWPPELLPSRLGGFLRPGSLGSFFPPGTARDPPRSVVRAFTCFRGALASGTGLRAVYWGP